MGLTVLVIDDDRHTRRILESLFRRAPELVGLVDEVLTAGDGQEGLALFESHHPQVVVTDLLLPRLDGFGFCRAVRARPAGRDTALIAVSAVYKDEPVVQRLKQEFRAQFFQKPFQVRDLVEAVRAVAQRLVQESDEEPTRVAESKRAAAPAKARVRQGSISTRPVPRLLLDLLEAQASGTLVLRRDRVRKDIYVLTGHPVGAASNVRQETLGYYLNARRVIDESQYRQALALSKQEKVKLGQALVRLGLLTEQELIRNLAALARLKIVGSLRWTQGSYRFVPGDTFSDRLPKGAFEPVHLVLAGLKRSARSDEIAKQLAVRESARVVLTPRGERHRDVGRKLFGEELLGAVESRPLVGELLRQGKRTLPLLAGVDALLQTGMAALEDAPASSLDGKARRRGRMATAAFAAITEEAPGADPLSLANLAEPTIPGALPAGTGGEATGSAAVALYEELFGDDSSQMTPVPRSYPGPAAPPVLEGAIPEPVEPQESGVIELPATLVGVGERAAAGAEAADPRVEEARQLIVHTYLDIHDKSYYEILQLGPDATLDEIAFSYGEALGKFRLARFEDLDLGRDYGRLEELHVLFRRAYEVLSDPGRRLDYDRQMGIDGTMPETPTARAAARGDPLAAELRFQEGLERLNAQRYGEAAAEFAAAASLSPDSADFHAHAGLATFLAGGREQLAVAQEHLRQALAIDGSLPSAHDFAGRIAAELGNEEEALAHLERALDFDPTRVDAFGVIEQILARRQDWRRLERQYRKLIHRVGEADPSLTLRLWWNLAEIYRTRLDDFESARVAFAIALRFAPREPALHHGLAAVTAHDPQRWRETAQALRTAWHLRPENPEPGRALFDLHVGGGRRDAARLCAAALIARGDSGNQAAVHYLGTYRPGAAPELTSLDPALWQRVRHPEDDAEVGELFALLAPVVARFHPFSLGDLEVTPEDRILLDDLPDEFARVLRYVCGLFDAAPPDVYRRADFGTEAHIGGTAPPVLLCGEEALVESEPAAMVFRLGRAASYLKPGRALGGALPARILKSFLLGAVALAFPDMPQGATDTSVAAVTEALKRLPPAAQGKIRELVERVTREKSTLNLSQWSRALSRSADRAGLLLCGDLLTAVRVVTPSNAPEAKEELIDFALSEEYLEARHELGFAARD